MTAQVRGSASIEAVCPCAGFPVLMIAFLGGFVHKLVPNVMSFTDYVKRRFGPVVQIYISLLMVRSSSCHLYSCSAITPAACAASSARRVHSMLATHSLLISSHMLTCRCLLLQLFNSAFTINTRFSDHLQSVGMLPMCLLPLMSMQTCRLSPPVQAFASHSIVTICTRSGRGPDGRVHSGWRSV